MKPLCAICGRPTVPAAYIGSEAIGPTCARRSGLLGLKIVKGSRVTFTARSRPTRDDRQLDLLASLTP